MKRMMYDTMAMVIVIVILIVTIFSGTTIARLVNNNNNNNYTREGIVVTTNTSTEEVIIVDTTGNEWCLYGVGYEEGDTVTMTMDNNNTDNIINDDIIKNVTVNTY